MHVRRAVEQSSLAASARRATCERSHVIAPFADLVIIGPAAPVTLRRLGEGGDVLLIEAVPRSRPGPSVAAAPSGPISPGNGSRSARSRAARRQRASIPSARRRTPGSCE